MNKAMRTILALGVAVMMLLGTATAFAADGLEVSEQTGPADKAADLQMPGSAVSKQAFGKLASSSAKRLRNKPEPFVVGIFDPYRLF